MTYMPTKDLKSLWQPLEPNFYDPHGVHDLLLIEGGLLSQENPTLALTRGFWCSLKIVYTLKNVYKYNQSVYNVTVTQFISPSIEEKVPILVLKVSLQLQEKVYIKKWKFEDILLAKIGCFSIKKSKF